MTLVACVVGLLCKINMETLCVLSVEAVCCTKEMDGPGVMQHGVQLGEVEVFTDIQADKDSLWPVKLVQSSIHCIKGCVSVDLKLSL